MRLLQQRNTELDFGSASDIASALNISLNTAKLLMLRGASTVKSAKDFLYPSTDSLNDPYDLKDMDKAVLAIKDQISKGSNICILGDYDADGVTSTALLYLTLKELGAKVSYYIPSRQNEGYGLTMLALENVMKLNPDFLITVDCGVTSIEEVKELYDRGVSVVITDHHKCPDILPDCEAVVNPNRQDCAYPFKGLAGVGVAAKLCEALTNKDFVLNFADLIALGTIADLMPLLSENRVYVKEGLSVINSGDCNKGISKLIEVSGHKGKKLSSKDIAFSIAPRINAGGRMSDNSMSVKLLKTADDDTALSIAKELNVLNTERQKIVSDIQKDVLKKLEAKKDMFNDYAVVEADPTYNHSVIGIVASRLVEKYYRPTIIFEEHDGMLVGSARSIEGIDIHKALANCSDLYERFGGHSQAAGLAMKADHYEEFIKRINDYLKETSKPENYIPKVVYDLKLDIKDIDETFVNELNMLEPYGIANPRPDFYLSTYINDFRKIGSVKTHLKFSVKEKNKIIDAVAFSYGYISDKLSKNQNIDMICKTEINEWNGNKKVQLNTSYIDNKANAEFEQFERSPWLFYDAMLDNVIYNYNIDTKTTEYSIITADKIHALFNESVWGNVIFCGSAEAANLVKNEILNDFNYYDEFIGYFDTENQYNAVVYAPLFEKMKNFWFKNAVYVDCALIIDISENNYVYNTKESQNIAANRDDLLKCYFEIKKLSNNKAYNSYEQICEQISLDNETLDMKFMCASIKIFEELKLIKIVNNGATIKIQTLKGAKADLNSSILYKALND